MKVLLVTGGRSPLTSWAPSDGSKFLNFCLRELGGEERMMVLGGAAGVDEFARKHAGIFKVNHLVLYLDWDRWGKRAGGKRAGMIRNAKMADYAEKLAGGLDGVLLAAFPGGRGTAGMVETCRRRGIRVAFLEEWLA